MAEGAVKRPVLRYHGGKWVIARWVIDHFSAHRCYVEPFAGAASVLMRKERSFSEVWNDLDDEVVNLFEILRDSGRARRLAELLTLTPWSRQEFWRAYEVATDPLERARRLVVRSYMAFGTTGRRKNRSGFRGKSERNNTTSVQDWLNYPASLQKVTARLQGVVIEARPAIEVIRQQDTEETLFYCDPPYVHATRTSMRWNSENDRCYAHEMTDQEHRELAEVLQATKGKVLISGYRGELYDELFSGWQRFEKRTYVGASGVAERTECLWLNEAAYEGLQREKVSLFVR